MGDVISSHLDEAKREIITAQTGEVMGEFGRLYEQQYAVALFNKVRFDIEGGGGPQPQLLHRKIPLENKSIFSGSLFQYLEENKKWRNRFLFVPDSYNINYFDSKAAHDRRLHPKGTINCAGHKVLTSMDQYLDLISNSLPGVKAKVGSSPFLKCPTQFPLILWHPYGRHYYFCVVTEKEQQKWHAVLQDCVRHANDGLSEENKIQTPAFTDAVRIYRQAKGHYGTWEMMCGVQSQILSNLVMEGLLPDLRELISPRLKGKLHERQRNWMLISDAVYSLVQEQCKAQYEAVVQKCESGHTLLEASIRTDMDQIITSKEHVTNKIRAVVLPKAEKLLKVSIEPYISSILDALMEPTSRGFSEVRDVFFRELVDMSKNTLNEGTKETVAQHMEKISMLAFHPVKMQSCYEKVEQLSLEGLQQRFDVSSPSVFVQRAQILMREELSLRKKIQEASITYSDLLLCEAWSQSQQMDDAVYTFEQILHQSLESQGTEELCKTIQRCQDRVIKKFDYDSSTVRKRFFREALLQIFIPYMLKQLSPSCASELPRFQELIFEDFSRFILVENIFEEVVLHSVMKDIMMAVKEAAVQRRHNLYRDSIVLSNSDPSLHLLGESPSIDWAGEYGGAQEEEVADTAGKDTEGDAQGEDGESQKRRRMKQVVSMIQEEGSPVLPSESCVEVAGIDDIPEESSNDEKEEEELSPDKIESPCPKPTENPPDLSSSSVLKEAEAKPEEAKPEGAKAEGAKPVEAKPVEAKPEEAKAEEAKAEEAKAEEAKAVEAKAVEAKAEEAKAEEAKAEEAKAEEAKAVEAKAVEAKAVEAKAVEAKAVEAKAEEAKAEEAKAEEAKPVEQDKEEVQLQGESSTATEEKAQGEDNQLAEEQQQQQQQPPPPTNQEVSKEVPPPPPPAEEVPPEATAEFPPPPYDDSGFQSPSSDRALEEEAASSKDTPQPAEETSVATAPQAETENQ